MNEPNVTVDFSAVALNGNRSVAVVKAAQWYIEKGYEVVPMPGGTKAPTTQGWNKKKYSAMDFTPGNNIGIKPVDGLVDVDLDVPEAVELARTLLPGTAMISGHKGNPNSHYWYCADGTTHQQFKDIDTTMLIERRASGVQTVVWPSIHPDGDQYIWYKDGVELSIPANELTERTEQLAATTLLARHWPQVQGSRHEFALGLAGFLTKGELDPDTVIAIVGDAARVGGDDEVDDRILAAQTTVERDQDSIKGQSVLVEIWGQKDAYAIIDRLTKWLHLKRQPREKQEAPKSEPVFEFTTFDQIEAKKPVWLWHGYIPLGKISIIDAAPNQGKSLVGIELIGRITTNGKMPDDSQGQIGGAVLIALEDDKADTVKPRLKAVKANMSRVIDLSHTKRRNSDGEIAEYPFVLPDDIDSLEAAIKAVDAKIVVIDPLNTVLNHKLKIQSDQDTRQALTPLARIAERTECAVVIIRHFTKEVRSDLIYQGAGNLGIIGAARSGLAIIPDPDNKKRHIFVVSKHNLTRNEVPNLAFITTDTGIEEEAFVKWDGEEKRPVAELMRDGNLGNLKQRLLKYLEDHGKTTLFTFYEAFNDISDTTLRSALSDLFTDGMIDKPDRGTYATKQPATNATNATNATTPQTQQTNNNIYIDNIYRENVANVANVAVVANVAIVGDCNPEIDDDCDPD